MRNRCKLCLNILICMQYWEDDCMYILGVIRQCVIHNSTGGMELVSHDLYRGLVGMGHKIKVLTSALDSQTAEIVLDGVVYVFMKDAPSGVYSNEFHLGVKNYLDWSIETEQVPHIIHSVSGAAKAATGNKYRIPVIATWHGTNVEQELDKMMSYKYVEQKNLLPSHCENLLFSLLKNSKLRADFQSFDGHIAISPFMKECVLSYGVQESKVAIIKNALPDMFLESFDSFKGFKKPKNKILIGLVGRPIPMKGHHFFSQVLERLDENKYEVLIVGGNKETLDFFKKSKVKVHCLSVDRKDMPSVYALMDVFVNPTFRYSGFDLTVQEALVSGVVVLNSDVGPYNSYYNELREVLGEKSPFFVFKVGDVDSCLGAINRIVVSRATNNFVSYFVENFRIKSMLASYVEFFNRISNDFKVAY